MGLIFYSKLLIGHILNKYQFQLLTGLYNFILSYSINTKIILKGEQAIERCTEDQSGGIIKTRFSPKTEPGFLYFGVCSFKHPDRAGNFD